MKTIDIAKTLRMLTDVILVEASRNEAFADELLRVLQAASIPKVATGKKSRLEKAEDDPFEMYRVKGEGEFRGWLEGLEISRLRAMVRLHRFDPSRLSDKWKTKDRFVSLILERVPARLKQGDVFQQYAGGRSKKKE